MPKPTPPAKTDVGLELVILYKTIKGAAEALIAIVLAFGSALGLATRVQDFIAVWAAHLTRAWSIQLAEKLFNASTTSHLRLAALALAFDGAFTSVEGWGLERHKRWAPWLIVVATSVLVPFEILALVRHVSAARVGMLAVNLVIVGYLAARLWHEHELRHPHGSKAPARPPTAEKP